MPKGDRLKIGGIEIEVTFKPIKNLHLSVHPPHGEVKIASPETYDLEKVKIYVATKLAWIKKQQEAFRQQDRETERQFLTQESHYLFGERYLMQVIADSRNRVEVKGKKLLLFVKEPDDLTLKKRTLESYYRKVLREKLRTLVEEYAAELNVEAPPFRIRQMKTKWGSCNTDHGRVWFNIELAKKPVSCIEYIVVHELVHLLERHHNKRFIMLMDQYLPGWRVQKKLLNELPLGW